MSQFQWNGDKLQAKVERATNAALTAGGLTLQRSMKRTLKLRKGPSSPGQPPGQETGLLGQSISIGTIKNRTIKVGTNLKYGRWLEYGVPSITPKRAKYLTVPVNRAAKRALIGANYKIRDLDLQFFRKGNKLFLGKIGNDGKVIQGAPLFVLKKFVSIAARPWVLPSFNAVRGVIASEMTEAFRRELSR